jgi:hypothetical protein
VCKCFLLFKSHKVRVNLVVVSSFYNFYDENWYKYDIHLTENTCVVSAAVKLVWLLMLVLRDRFLPPADLNQVYLGFFNEVLSAHNSE